MEPRDPTKSFLAIRQTQMALPVGELQHNPKSLGLPGMTKVFRALSAAIAGLMLAFKSPNLAQGRLEGCCNP